MDQGFSYDKQLLYPYIYNQSTRLQVKQITLSQSSF